MAPPPPPAPAAAATTAKTKAKKVTTAPAPATKAKAAVAAAPASTPTTTTAPPAMPPAKLLPQLQAKLENVTRAKEENATKGKALDEQLQRLFKNAPKRPTITLEKIEEEINRLEHRRNTTSMSLNDEKYILREIQLLTAKKSELAAAEEFQARVDGLKKEREERFQRNRSYGDELQQLTTAIKKATLAVKVDAAIEDFETVELVIPEDRMGSVIGKGYVMAHKIEADCGVLLETEAKSTRIRLTGTPANLRRAREAIENITLATSHTLGLHPDTIKVLMSQKGKNVQELEQRLGLKIDINRAEGLLTVLAAPARLAELEMALKELEAGKVDIQLPAEIVPKLIGKKGETINQLMEDTGCMVDIDKVTNAVRLCGPRESVAMAKKFIHELIEDQSQREREFSVHDEAFFSADFAAHKFPFFVEFLMANKAQQLKLLRTDASDAKIKVLKDERALQVTGNKQQLAAMEEALRERLREFEHHHWLYEVPDQSLLSVIIGKKGQRIKQIEEEFKAQHIRIDIEGRHVCVLGDTREAIDSARDKILEVVDQNQRSVFVTSPHLIAVLVNNKRAKLIEIETSSSCKLNLPPPTAANKTKAAGTEQVKIQLTGTLEAITAAKDQLERLDEAHHVRYVPLDDDEVPTVIGKKGETISELEADSGARLRVVRGSDASSTTAAAAELEMIGTDEQLAKVQTRLDALLQTENRELLQLDPFATGCLIGKKGERIKAIRQEHPDASLDAFIARGQVRIKASNPAALRACVEHVQRLLRETQVVETVRVPSDSTANFKTLVDKNPAIARRLQELEAEGGEGATVVIQDDGKSARIRGPALGIGALKAFLEMLVAADGHFVESIRLPTLALGSVLLVKGGDKLNDNALRIAKLTGCEIRVKRQGSSAGVVRIEGTNAAKVYDAKDQVEKVLQFYHGECVRVLESLPAAAVPRLYELLPTLAASHAVVFSLPTPTSLRVFTDSKATTATVVKRLEAELVAWRKQHVEVAVPVWLVPVLLGKNGETIKRLESESQNARLDLGPSGSSNAMAPGGGRGGTGAAKNKSSSSGDDRVLTISAREDATLQLAVANVKEFIRQQEARTATVDVPAAKLDLVLSLRKELPKGVQLHVPPLANAGAETVRVMLVGGENEQREAAVERLEHAVETSAIETIVLPATAAAGLVIGALIGKGGANIKALQKEFPNVGIDIQRGDEHAIRLRGPQEDVARVQRIVDDKVRELLRQQEAFEERARQQEAERQAARRSAGGRAGEDKAKGASASSTDDAEDAVAAGDENAQPNQHRPPAPAGPVGGPASLGQPKLNKNQRRRMRKRAENEKKSDVLSMIMGDGENQDTAAAEAAAASEGYYHSTSGYSLRL